MWCINLDEIGNHWEIRGQVKENQTNEKMDFHFDSYITSYYIDYTLFNINVKQHVGIT